MFKDDFIWGVASSAYQVEGTDEQDGRGKNIWDVFAEGGHIFENQTADISCDHMHHYKEDIALMGSLGIKAYRFSVSWARLMPKGTSEVNQKAVDMYRDMIIEMKKNGIEPYLTIYHWELPQALQEKGGWLNEEIVQWFGDYARVIVENFSDLVSYYFTMNEPQCFTGFGYLTGFQAPGLKLSYKETFQVVHNALRAHGQATKMLRKYAKQEIKIGFAPTCGVAIPYSEEKRDIEAAKKAYFGFYNTIDNWTWNVSWFSDPIILGKYPKEGLEKYAEYLPVITDEDMELISQPIDFIGQNIYNGHLVRAGVDGEPEFVNRPQGTAKTANNWAVVPRALYWGLKFNYERYQLPIYITENGMSCHDSISLDGKVHDPNRIDFLERYLAEAQKAVDEGVDFQGYFLWTFLDNFEWGSGYNERFGLVFVDYETQKRIPKDSAYWYKKIIESKGKELHINKVK